MGLSVTPRFGGLAGKIALAVLVSTAAGTAAFGVPRLLQRQHEVEGVRQLARLARAASLYYVKPRPDEYGNRLPCQFPPGDVRTVAAKSCWSKTVGDGEGNCDPTRIEWNRTLWNALRFRIDEAQPYVFEYVGSGTMAEAVFTVSAYGDLDGDGQHSTFRFTGHGDPRSTPDDCVMGSEPAFEILSRDE